MIGVGLALARSIVELHHGTLEAKSAGLGKGSEFIVCLPLMAADPNIDSAPARELEKEQASCAGEAPSRRILVVDDNVDAAVALAALLKKRAVLWFDYLSHPAVAVGARR